MSEEDLDAKKAWLKEARKNNRLHRLKYAILLKYWAWRYARARRAFRKAERLAGFKIEPATSWTDKSYSYVVHFNLKFFREGS